jgi:5-oxoprolinase (ATP-hydrolysing)
MTNTAITDVEIIERRYPVRITAFKLRHGSGGVGRHRGGEGLIRSWHFLAPLTVSLLTEHRTTGPQGLNGGTDGAPGRQWLTRADGHVEMLPATTAVLVQPGDTLTMETPGGGAWGV